MATEFVTIKHPDLEGTATASRQAFEEVWKDKGFELADDEETQQAAGEQRQVTRGPAQTSQQQKREESKRQGEKDES